MQVDLNGKLKTSDGHDAGTIERAVVDPNTNEVTEFIINTGGLLGRTSLIRRADIEAASFDGEMIVLKLSKDDVEKLPDYMPGSYVLPPEDWVAPYGYGLEPGAYVWPSSYVASLPPEAGLVTINKGASVIDKADHEIGVVDEVLLDQGSGALTGFILRVGNAFIVLFGGGETITVNRDQIDHVGQGQVYLKLRKEDMVPVGRH